MVAKLRPETDVPGLYLTGQDILSCGFTGALFAGVVSAQVSPSQSEAGREGNVSGNSGKKCSG